MKYVNFLEGELHLVHVLIIAAGALVIVAIAIAAVIIIR
jgi:hypothetical protein